MKIIRIDESLFPSDENEAKAAFHQLIARELDFPEYYGRNLSALNDCLGDICSPTKIIINRARSIGAADHEPSFFDKVCNVMQRSALQNEYLEVELRWPDEN